MNLLLVGSIMLYLIFLTWRVWLYRLAIIQLQADMTLVLNDLTRPSVPLRVVKSDRVDMGRSA